MLTTELRPPVSLGESAPDFRLPAVDGSGTVSLAEYRGRNSVFLALFVGLWCPFCRRAIAQVAANESKLKAHFSKLFCLLLQLSHCLLVNSACVVKQSAYCC